MNVVNSIKKKIWQLCTTLSKSIILQRVYREGDKKNPSTNLLTDCPSDAIKDD